MQLTSAPPGASACQSATLGSVTNDDATAHDDTNLPDDVTVDDYGHPDITLQALINMANVGAEMSITVWLRGEVVSGVMVSGQRYFEQTARLVRDNVLTEAGEAMAKAFDLMAEDQETGRLRRAETSSPPFYFHLLAEDSGNPLLRGRVVSVDGWHLGT